MKKLYTLLAGVLVTTGAFANITVTANTADAGMLSTVRIGKTLKSDLRLNSGKTVAKAAKKAAPAKAHAFASVADMVGEYNLSYTDAYEGTEATKKVTVTAVAGSDNKVSISNFFYDESIEATVDLSAKTLTIAYQKVDTDPNYGDVYVGDVKVSGSTPTALKTDAVCTIDTEAGSISFPTYFGCSVSAGFFEIYALAEMTYIDESSAFEASYSDCTVDGKLKLAFQAGSSITDVKYDIYAGNYEGSVENLEYVLENGAKSAGATSLDGALNCSSLDHGVYTLFLIGVDENGAYVNGLACNFYSNVDEADKWSEGVTAKYVDDYISSAFNNMNDTERDVTIQEHLTTPGFYRVVNPLATHKAKVYNSHSLNTEGDHNHYLYIHAEDPEKVYIEDSAMGFSYGDEDGMMVGTSYISYLKDDGATDDELASSGYYGTLKDNVITFPTKSLLLSFLKEGKLYYANSNGAFKLTLPEKDAVESIVADNDENAPVEYFNLYGQRIQNPAAGQLVIRRQGAKAQKILVK